MRTLDLILSKAYSQYGASIGRRNVGSRPMYKRVYDCEVRLNRGGYDKGGAYWGIGRELRVSYTKDLSYIKFYRVNRFIVNAMSENLVGNQGATPFSAFTEEEIRSVHDWVEQGGSFQNKDT